MRITRLPSTDGQSPKCQLDSVALDRAFADTTGENVRERPELAALLDRVRPGDTIHVHSLDRLVRSLAHLLELVETITRQGVTLRFHREGLSVDGGERDRDAADAAADARGGGELRAHADRRAGR